MAFPGAGNDKPVGGFAKISSSSSPFLNMSGGALPPPSMAAQIVDTMIQDPAVSAELRARMGGKPYRERRGQRWVARRDGSCNKTVGWLIDDRGYLLSRECGAPILTGEECWRQDGHLYYGRDCHPRGLVVLPKLWVGEHIMNSSELANNLPDRRKWLVKAEELWKIEVDAGRLRGEWGDPDRKASEQEICASILAALMEYKAGVKPLVRPTVVQPPRKVKKVSKKDHAPVIVEPLKPESKTMKGDKDKDGKIVLPKLGPDKIVTQPVLGVVKRFAGPKGKALAEGYALQFNNARPKHLQPLTVEQEGTQWVVVNPDMARAEAKRREKMQLTPGIIPLDPAQPAMDAPKKAIQSQGKRVKVKA